MHMNRKDWLWLLLVLVIAAVLRFVWIGQKSIWLDEAISVLLSSGSQAKIWAQNYGVRPETHPPLYYSVLGIWMNLFGRSETAVRFPSALISIVNVGLLYWLARRLFNHEIAFMAAGLLAVSPLHIWYGQEARMYVFMTAISLLAALCLTWDRWWTFFPLTAVLTLGLYLDYTLLLQWTVISAIWFVVWWQGEKRVRSLLVWLGATAAALLLYLPWWQKFIDVLAIFNDIHLFELLQARLGIPVLSPAQYLLLLPLLGLGIVIGVAIFNKIFRQAQFRGLLTWLILAGFLLLTLFFPVPRFYGIKRVLVLFWPFIILLVAWLIEQLTRRKKKVWAIFMGVSVCAACAAIFAVPKDDWRGATAVLNNLAQQQDIVWLDPLWNNTPYQYYEPLIAAQRGDVEKLVELTETGIDRVDAVNIWIIAERFPANPVPSSPSESWLDQNWQLVEALPFYRLELRRYQQRP